MEWVKGKLFHPPTDTEKKRNDLLTQARWRSHWLILLAIIRLTMRLQPPFREPTSDRIVSSDACCALQAQRKVAEIPAAHRLHTVKISTHYGVSMPARQPVSKTARTFNEHGRLRCAALGRARGSGLGVGARGSGLER